VLAAGLSGTGGLDYAFTQMLGSPSTTGCTLPLRARPLTELRACGTWSHVSRRAHVLAAHECISFVNLTMSAINMGNLAYSGDRAPGTPGHGGFSVSQQHADCGIDDSNPDVLEP
jgi:hypothetical protein